MIDAIERTLELESPMDDVWRALTDPTELSGWLGDTTELNPSAGSQGWFGFEGHGRFAVEVEEFDPPHRLVWRGSHEPGKSLAESTVITRVEWTLEPRDGGGTLLHLRESGFATVEHRQQNVDGWKTKLPELQAYLAGSSKKREDR